MSKQEKTFATFAEYAEATSKQFPNPGIPEAAWDAQLVSGWKVHCSRTGREPIFPPLDGNAQEAPEVVAQWRERAFAAAKVARDFGGVATTMSIPQLEAAWLAVRGRAPSGHLLAK